jgi:hypothetical protein
MYTHVDKVLEDKACDDIDLGLGGEGEELSPKHIKLEPLFSAPIGGAYSKREYPSTRYVYSV